MIRNATPDDKVALLALAEATELFSPEDLEGFAGMMDEQLASGNEGDDVWITDDEDGLRGAAYYAPEPFAEGEIGRAHV